MTGEIFRHGISWMMQNGSSNCWVGTIALDKTKVMPKFFKPYGDPFEYENNDPFPCQLFVTSIQDFEQWLYSGERKKSPRALPFSAL